MSTLAQTGDAGRTATLFYHSVTREEEADHIGIVKVAWRRQN